MRKQSIFIWLVVFILNACKEEKLLQSSDVDPNKLIMTTGTAHNGRIGLFPNNENGRTTLRIKFLEETEDNEKLRKLIIQHAKEWEDHANIFFDFVGKDENSTDIRIALNCTTLGGNVSGNSFIGVSNRYVSQNEATMKYAINLNELYLKRVVLHEFGHALGLDHEQDHPNSVVIRDRVSNKKLYSNYDKSSIMHYSFDAGSTTDNSAIYAGSELSDEDKYFIGTLYPFPTTENYAQHNEEKIYTLAGGLDITQNKVTNHIVLYPLRESGSMSKVENDTYTICDSKNNRYTFQSNQNFPTSRFTNANLIAPIVIYRNGERLTNEWIQLSANIIDFGEEIYKLDDKLSVYRDRSNDGIILQPPADGYLNKDKNDLYDIHDADGKHFQFNSKTNLLQYNIDPWKKFIKINLKAPIVIYKNGQLVKKEWFGYDPNNQVVRQKVEKHVYTLDRRLKIFMEKHSEKIIIYPFDSKRTQRSAYMDVAITLHDASGKKYVISPEQHLWGRTSTGLHSYLHIDRAGRLTRSWIDISSNPNTSSPPVNVSEKRQKIYTIDGLSIFKEKSTRKIVLLGELYGNNKNEYQIRDQSPNRVYTFNLSNNRDFKYQELPTDLIAPIAIYVNRGRKWEYLEKMWIGEE